MPQHEKTKPLALLRVHPASGLLGQSRLLHGVALLDEAWTFLAMAPHGAAPKPQAPPKASPPPKPGHPPSAPPKGTPGQGAPKQAPRRHQGR